MKKSDIFDCFLRFCPFAQAENGVGLCKQRFDDCNQRLLFRRDESFLFFVCIRKGRCIMHLRVDIKYLRMFFRER